MLTEAGETFEQKEVEINKMKELNAEYEKKMEAQVTAHIIIRRYVAAIWLYMWFLLFVSISQFGVEM